VWVLEKFYGIPWEQIVEKLLLLLQAEAILTETLKPALEENPPLDLDGGTLFLP